MVANQCTPIPFEYSLHACFQDTTAATASIVRGIRQHFGLVLLHSMCDSILGGYTEHKLDFLSITTDVRLKALCLFASATLQKQTDMTLTTGKQLLLL
jgi:hypothetical protein